MDVNKYYQAFLYLKGIRKGEPILLSTRIERIHNNVEAAKELIIRFSIPKSYHKKVSPSSDLLFAVRINGETKDKTVFPFNDKGEQRYMGTIADLGTFSPIFGLNQTEKIKIGNLDELKQAKTWQ